MTTGTFGNYHFDDVTVGETYTITATAPRITFAPRVVQIDDAIDRTGFGGQ